jgi:hypothetical protein
VAASTKTPADAPSPALKRSRATRERRKRGVLLIRLELPPALLNGMVTAALLSAADWNDSDAATRAVLACVERATTVPSQAEERPTLAGLLGGAIRRRRGLGGGRRLPCLASVHTLSRATPLRSSLRPR